MSKILSLVFLVTLVGAISGCTTISTWDKGIPETGDEITSQSQRRSEYQHFMVRSAGLYHGNAYFEVRGEGDDQPKFYSSASFFPVIEDVCPELKNAMDHADDLGSDRGWAHAATGAGLAAMILGPNRAVRNVGTAALIGGAGGTIYLEVEQRRALRQVMEHYNRQLSERIYHSALKPPRQQSVSSEVPPEPSFKPT